MLSKDPKYDHTKSKVYALYYKNRLTPGGVVEIEKENGIIRIGLEDCFKCRIKQAWQLVWHLVIHRGFTLRAHTIEEKTKQEILDWYAGKGLK